MEQRKKRKTQESVIVKDPNTGFEVSFSINSRLKRNLDKNVIKALEKENKDCVIILDGREGSGKSTLAMQIGKYCDPTLDLSRIVFSPEDFREAILKSKKGQCIIYDEAFTGFSSRGSLSPINKVLVSLAMQMRQKNLFIIIVLPTIFMLDKYMAMHRTKALIHVFESKGVRGYFRLFNNKKKKLLLLFGSKTMSHSVKQAWTNFKGRFYGKFAIGDSKVEAEYIKKKEISLEDSEKASMSSAQVRYKEQRDLMMWLFKKYTNMTYKDMSTLISDYDFHMSLEQISKICAKFGLLTNEIVKNDEKVIETDDISIETDEIIA
jgi:adenylate kinase family enzyme